jgi:hypothetical protein
MTDQEELSLKEIKRKEKSIDEEAKRLAKEQVRKKAYLAREKALDDVQKERELKRLENLAKEEIEQLAKEQARKETYLAREKAIAEDQEMRKLKVKKQQSK